MITTAIVLPVRYYPLSALLPAFLPAVEKKKKKKTKEREKEREKERWGEGGEKWVGTKSGWWVKIGNDALSSCLVARYSKRRTKRWDGKVGDEACETGYDIRSDLGEKNSITTDLLRVGLPDCLFNGSSFHKTAENIGNTRRVIKRGTLESFVKVSKLQKRRNCFEMSRSMKETHRRS